MQNLRQLLGVGTLEVVLSLSVMAILIVMAMRYCVIKEGTHKINVARQQVGALIAAVDAWQGRHPQLASGLSVTTLYRQGFIAKMNHLVVDGDTANLYDPWGHAIRLFVADHQAFISMSLPNTAHCRALRSSYPSGHCADHGGVFQLLVPPVETLV